MGSASLFRSPMAQGGRLVRYADQRIERHSMGNRLYVGNLSFNATNDSIRELVRELWHRHRRPRRHGS